MKDRRLLGLAVAMLVVVATWWLQTGPFDPSQEPDRTSSTAPSSTDAPGDESGLDVVAEDELPVEGRDTLALIDAGGPFPYDRDGVVFENRERILPAQDLGYYREYTVPTPGEGDRGARRIVTGSGGDYYYTADHYRSFVRIDRG